MKKELHHGIFHLAIVFFVCLFSAGVVLYVSADGTSTDATSGSSSSTSGSGGSTTFTDTIPPTPPTGVFAQPASGHVTLSWTAATDNSGVVGYRIFRNGAYYMSVSSTGFTDGAVVSGTVYTYFVKAADAAGNESAPSGTVSTMLTVATTENTTNTSSGATSTTSATSGSGSSATTATSTSGTTNTTSEANTTNPTVASVSFRVETKESFCDGLTPKTYVVLKADPVGGGYFQIDAFGGSGTALESGVYPMPNHSYHWVGVARSGFTLSGVTSGYVTVAAPPCPGTALPTTTTTTTPTTAMTFVSPTTTSANTISDTTPPPPKITTPITISTTPKIEQIDPARPRTAATPVTQTAPPRSEVRSDSFIQPTEPVSDLESCRNAEECARVCAERRDSCATFTEKPVIIVTNPSRPVPGPTSTEVRKVGDVHPADIDQQREYFASFASERVGVRAFADTDNDGVGDYDEINVYGTDPKNSDTNKDGTPDGESLLAGKDPLAESLPAAVLERLRDVNEKIAEGADPMDFEGEMQALKNDYPHAPEVTGGPRVEDPRTAPGTTTLLAVTHVALVPTTAAPSSENIPALPALISLSGKALPNAIVTLYIFSDPIVVRVKADESGAWTYTLDKELPDGAHEVYSAITDAGGKILARSEPLPFVKRAEALTIGAEIFPTPQESAPGFFDSGSILALGLMLLGILGIAITVIGLVVRRRRDDEMSLPPLDAPPPPSAPV